MGQRIRWVVEDDRHWPDYYQNVEAIHLSELLCKTSYLPVSFPDLDVRLFLANLIRKSVIFVVLFCTDLTTNEEEHFPDVSWPLASFSLGTCLLIPSANVSVSRCVSYLVHCRHSCPVASRQHFCVVIRQPHTPLLVLLVVTFTDKSFKIIWMWIVVSCRGHFLIPKYVNILLNTNLSSSKEWEWEKNREALFDIAVWFD